jgi:hypothetical protein
MKDDTPEALDLITDVVLAYRPKAKEKKPRKRKVKKRKQKPKKKATDGPR